jgi:hypothetical protein
LPGLGTLEILSRHKSPCRAVFGLQVVNDQLPTTALPTQFDERLGTHGISLVLINLSRLKGWQLERTHDGRVAVEMVPVRVKLFQPWRTTNTNE